MDPGNCTSVAKLLSTRFTLSQSHGGVIFFLISFLGSSRNAVGSLGCAGGGEGGGVGEEVGLTVGGDLSMAACRRPIKLPEDSTSSNSSSSFKRDRITKLEAKEEQNIVIKTT